MATVSLQPRVNREPVWRAAWAASRAGIEPAWRAAHERWAGDDLGSDPDWCRAFEQIYPGALRWVTLEAGEDRHVIPLRVQASEMRCCLGELNLMRFQPRLLQLAGDTIGLPDGEAGYEALFTTVLQHGEEWDALRFTVPTTAPLWAWLNRGKLEQMGMHRYEPEPPRPHDLLGLPASFADYTAKFSAKTRKNREREVRHLAQQGAVRLQCYRRPEEIEPYLAEAGAISRRSYQHKLLKVGLREAARLRPRLEVAAQQGWWRSYILWCGEAACSFMLGYQYRGRYNYTSIGFDPAWAKWDVGTVLHWLALQDMCDCDPPTVFDFGVRGPQKQYFGNRSFEEATLYYFRPGVYPWLVRTCYDGSLQLTGVASRWLARHQLKPRAQRLLRRLRRC